MSTQFSSSGRQRLPSNWNQSKRKQELPSDWPRRRRRVLRRDNYQCQWRLPDGDMCGDHANQCDHITPGDDHQETNLQALCEHHHNLKSSQEGAEALHAKRREINQRFKRTEEHPGMI